MPSIKPIDRAAIVEAAKTGLVLTVENHSVIGGLGSAVAEVLAEENADATLERIGMQDCFGMTATLAYQMEANGLTGEAVAKTAAERLQSIR